MCYNCWPCVPQLENLYPPIWSPPKIDFPSINVQLVPLTHFTLHPNSLCIYMIVVDFFVHIFSFSIYFNNVFSFQCLSFSFPWLNWFPDIFVVVVNGIVSRFLFLLSPGQLLRRVWLFGTRWPAGCQASESLSNSRGLLKLMSIESVKPSKHLILCRPLLLCLQSRLWEADILEYNYC